MPLDFVLVRHGQSEGNRDGIFTSHSDSGLTALGQRQAEAVAAALLAETHRPPLKAIYTSDLRRAVDTAAPLAAASGLRPIEEPALRERTVGDFTGLSFAAVQERHPEAWRAMLARDADYCPPGGESNRDCRVRVSTFLEGLLARHAEDVHARIVLCSHGIAINHLLRHVLGIEEGASRTYFQISNCSLTRFERRDDGSFRVFAVNEIAHLVRVGTDAG
jgi:probable phosphoglycerate mutase